MLKILNIPIKKSSVDDPVEVNNCEFCTDTRVPGILIVSAPFFRKLVTDELDFMTKY